VKAVKALLLSGDREKIVFFAGVSRAREVYILAANYLRTLPWQDDADLAKQIATFYQKAKAIDHLVAFYESVARAEIDEFRDYDKGLAALENAIAALEKAGGGGDAAANAKLASLRQRAALVGRFVETRARLKIAPDAQASLAAARDLLAAATAAARRDGDAATASVAVRPGDVYAMMIEHVYARGDANGACDLLEEMSREGVVVGPYVDDHVVAAATRDAGRTLSLLKGGGVRDSGLVQGVTLGIDGGVVDEEWSPPPPPEDFDDDDDDDA
jgi:intraflagellar transport protein 140